MMTTNFLRRWIKRLHNAKHASPAAPRIRPTVERLERRDVMSGPSAVDLSTYVRVGRFDLPEPTRTTPPDNFSLLAQEASAVTYDWDTDTLFVVGGGKFVLLEERYRQANLFTYVAGGTLHQADAQTVKLGTTIGNIGLEGISYDPLTGGFICVKEKDPESIFQTGIDFVAGTATNGSP